jgi:hypothetical protein
LKKIIALFSYFFHPIFVPLFGTFSFFLLSSFNYTYQQKYLIFLQIGIVTILIPIAFFYFLRSFEKADNGMVPDLFLLKIPLLFHGMILYLLLSNTIKESILPELYFYLLGGLISTFILFILLVLKIKASIHLVGISALTVYVGALSLHFEVNSIYSIAVLVLLNGLVATYQLELKETNYKEIVLGFFIGLLPQLVLTYFWL